MKDIEDLNIEIDDVESIIKIVDDRIL